MIKALTQSSLKFVVRELNLQDKYEIDRMRFGLETFIGESIKLIVVLSLALIIKKVPELFIFTLMLMFLRSSIGGSHAKSFSGCLFMTIVIYLSICFLSDMIGPPSLFYGIISVGLTVGVLCNVKKVSRVQTKEASKEETFKFRGKLIALVLLSIIIIYIFYFKGLTVLLLTQNFIVLNYLYHERGKKI